MTNLLFKKQSLCLLFIASYILSYLFFREHIKGYVHSANSM